MRSKILTGAAAFTLATTAGFYAPLYGYDGAHDWAPGGNVEVPTRASGR